MSISFEKHVPANHNNRTRKSANQHSGLLGQVGDGIFALHGRKAVVTLRRTEHLWKQDPSTTKQWAKENLDRRVVKFDTLQIREYSVSIGDSPAVTIGPPLGIDWPYIEHEKRPVDEYEKKRKHRRRSGRVQLTLNYYQRHKILENAGFSKKEIEAAEREADKARKQRQSSKFWYPVASKFE